jgi:lipid II:glycine glycyltransferase (peptidoglycan interpeptide bridge formation enzyme)
MSGSLNIQYLTNRQIDKPKWDNCIDNATNGLIYGYSFYLDHMAKHWDALVLNDYEAVMPLTWKNKFGINYLYQPFLTAQLGIFGKQITEEQVRQFIESIPTSFRLIEINLNSGNVSGFSGRFSIKRNNYVLNLNKSYEELYMAYRENIRRNIKKAKQIGCQVLKDFDAQKTIELAVQQMKSQGNEEKENINHFRKLFKYLLSRQMATSYGVFSRQNELLSSCVFFFSHSRAYYILVGNHPGGKSTGASHALIDAFIKDNSEKNMLLDFEGSDISSLAHFYSGFGATNEIYPALKINRLPFYLRWLKN